MTEGPRDRSHGVPPRQNPYEHALRLGFQELLADPPSQEKLDALGASGGAEIVRLPALNRALMVDSNRRDVFVEGGGPAKRTWAILCVHYLCAKDLSPDAREVGFGQFSDSMSYSSVFDKRIVERFLATSGSTPERFVELSEQLGAERLPGSGIRYEFFVLPRVPIIIARYEGDDELGPGASMIYRADAAHLLPAEDRVVSAELLLGALAGKGMEESPGGSQ